MSSAHKIHKVVGSPADNTPWMQSTPSNSVPDQYFSSNNNSGILADSDPENIYMSDTSKSTRSHNSTTDMCVERNTEGKPPYSYATLIKYAIERSVENKLTLSQIYQWVIDHYPYYGSAGSGWKNSIRHNLSLNKNFVRVPRPVNEPGKGSYWTVDSSVVDTDQRTRTTVRGRSSRSSSDSSLHRAGNNNDNDSWTFRGNSTMNRNYRDGRSLSTDAGVSSSTSSSALRRSSQYGYCSHPYAGYNQAHYSYPNYQQHQYHQQRMPSHETLLSARQHSSVTYTLPASASYNQSTLLNSNMYSPMNAQPFYSHRQSCPDFSSMSTTAYSETGMLPTNFNTTGLEPSPTSSFGENKIIYTTPPSNSNSFPTPAYNDHQQKLFGASSTRSPMSPFFKEHTAHDHNNDNTPGLPSPVLSPSNCSSSSSSQHLSVADPLASIVTQHPSPVTTTTVATPGNNRLRSPYYSSASVGLTTAVDHINQSSASSSVSEECLTSPSSPMILASSLGGSPVPFCLDTTGTTTPNSASVAYMELVSQHQQQQQQ